MKPEKWFVLLLVIALASCEFKGEVYSKNESNREKQIKDLLRPFRTNKPVFHSQKDKNARGFYNAVYTRDLKAVTKYLKNGSDPNYCFGECGWSDSNPLNVVAESFYNTYYRDKIGEILPKPAPDVELLQILVRSGADINIRPYIWIRVFTYNDSYHDIEKQRRGNHETVEPNEIQEQLNKYISDSNRLIEAFLRAGADVDKKGHPYPFGYEALKAGMTDEEANQYFLKGTRAINVAIEKGIDWESQVDLLLKYTKIDAESLEAAKRSKDPKMIEKIEKLWNEQQSLKNE